MSKLIFDGNFIRACEENQVDVVKKCLLKGNDVNQQSHDWWFGLLFAAYNDYPDLCDLLLKQPGLNVNLKNRNQRTALMISCAQGKDFV